MWISVNSAVKVSDGWIRNLKKEEVISTFIFITWTIFAIYLHIWTNPNPKGANSAIVASLGFFYNLDMLFGSRYIRNGAA